MVGQSLFAPTAPAPPGFPLAPGDPAVPFVPFEALAAVTSLRVTSTTAPPIARIPYADSAVLAVVGPLRSVLNVTVARPPLTSRPVASPVAGPPRPVAVTESRTKRPDPLLVVNEMDGAPPPPANWVTRSNRFVFALAAPMKEIGDVAEVLSITVQLVRSPVSHEGLGGDVRGEPKN